MELLITMTVLAIMASIAFPSFLKSFDRSQATICLINRQNIQVAADIYIKTHNLVPGDPMPTISQLVAENLLTGEEQCPAGGIYVWTDPVFRGFSTPFLVSCSVHYLVVEKDGKFRKGW